MVIKLLFSICFFILTNIAFAQTSWRIHWVEKEKNPSFFEKGKELPVLLINAAKSQKITPYQLPIWAQIPQKLSAQDFKKNIKIPQIKGALITDDKEAINFPENAQWFAKDMSLFAVYEAVTAKGSKLEYLALYVPYNEQRIFIAAFQFKEVEKILKKNKLALWQFPVQANFGEVLHLDIDDGSAYRVAKTLLLNKHKDSALAEKIADESLAYQWLVRPIEQKSDKGDYQPVSIEIYHEDSAMQLVEKVDFEQVKHLISGQEIYFLSYVEALKQKLFISDLQPVMPTPTRKEKTSKLFQKPMISDLNLKENENKFFFQPAQEIVKYLIEGFQNKQIKAYLSDSLKTRLTATEFRFSLSVPQLVEEDADTTSAKMWEISQLSKLYLTETMRFDQKGQRKTYQTKALAIVLPAQENLAKSIDEPLVYFSYAEVMRLLKKKKQYGMINLFKNRSFKLIPLFMEGSRY